VPKKNQKSRKPGDKKRNREPAMPTDSDARRVRLLKFLASKKPAWKDKDHPELKEGAAAWVRKLRGHQD
jgi:hypothetical protein